MTSLSTRFMQPQHRKTAIQAVSAELIDDQTKAAQLDSRRAELMNQIKDLSYEVVKIDFERDALRIQAQTLAHMSPLAAKDDVRVEAPEVAAPEPETQQFEGVGGRPIKGVLSTQKWYELMTGDAEAVTRVAHYYGRPDSGMARLRTRALNGELPDSKVQHEVLQMLQDGEDPVLVAQTTIKPLNWVKNYNNLLTAYNRMYAEGLKVPENILSIITGA
ncbi:hypothetical protein Dxin01_00093 [Deinococcus xinjiangensis]|uniref:Uncharacterized protein n=1 Tax=Deinococcus xinjiangensis TaxID=457454 RepID=A0ABP9V519_9DEIO